MPFIIVIAGLHIWGRRKNKRKARSWVAAHAPTLEKEYAVVGMSGQRPKKSALAFDEAQSAAEEESTPLSEILQEKTAQEYMGYATGRQNVAFMDIKLKLFKRYNPMTLLLEFIFSFLFESIRAPRERMELTTYTFDGKERDMVPVRSKAELEAKDSRFKGLPQSGYDAFVWAVVHKDGMKSLRDERYDISLTATKDHARLPIWATTMSESAEVTEQLLSKELAQAIEQAGDDFEHLIVTDQPIDKPTK